MLYLEDYLMYEHHPWCLWVSMTERLSLWAIFHCPLILPYISKTIWWMNVIFLDNETVWHKLWPQTKYRSTGLIFHGLVILLNIFKFIWWVNMIVGILDQCDTKTESSSICRSVTYILWSIDFVPYLEECAMEKCCTWDNGPVWHKDWPLKIYMGQWPIFHGPLILPFVIVIDLNYLYTLWKGAGRGCSCPSRHLL